MSAGEVDALAVAGERDLPLRLGGHWPFGDAGPSSAGSDVRISALHTSHVHVMTAATGGFYYYRR